jgi:hypothetical protein
VVPSLVAVEARKRVVVLLRNQNLDVREASKENREPGGAVRLRVLHEDVLDSLEIISIQCLKTPDPLIGKR